MKNASSKNQLDRADGATRSNWHNVNIVEQINSETKDEYK